MTAAACWHTRALCGPTTCKVAVYRKVKAGGVVQLVGSTPNLTQRGLPSMVIGSPCFVSAPLSASSLKITCPAGLWVRQAPSPRCWQR